MVIGEYVSKVGDKKRVSIPKKFRDELGSDMILTRGYEGSLVLVNKQMWDKVASEIVNGSFINKNVRETSRFLVGSAIEVKADNQGRFVVPSGLFDYAEIKSELVFIGLINWVEIWEKSKWQAKVEFLASNSEQIADELQKMTPNANK
jgi:MraZ protein